MTWERLRVILGYAPPWSSWRGGVLVLRGVLEELEKSQFIGFIGGVVLGVLMVGLITVFLIVPERRWTWVRAITSVNARYLFLDLIIAWSRRLACWRA